MAAHGKELPLGHLPDDEKSPDYFKALVKNCIKAYGKFFSDTTSLDYNGVVGRMRILVLEDETYIKETKKLKAKKTLDDLSDLDMLNEEILYEDDEDSPGEPIQVVPDGLEEEPIDETFDILRDKKKKEVRIIPAAKEKPAKKRKFFDKDQINLRMKIIQMKNDALSQSKGDEEKEGDSINLFFQALSREDYEAMKIVEISASSKESGEAFITGDDEKVAKLLGKDKKVSTANMDAKPKYHMEGDMMVEDI